ncbi:MAG: phage portal protein [Mycobacterium sp.]|nr:MAG: phage portal protein [Mycobacterium sp.]
MSTDLLVEALQELDASQARYAHLQRYATGTQPLAFLSNESRKALDNRLCRMSIGVPALAVSSLSERLRPNGFSDERAWDLFVQSDLDQLAVRVHSDALTFGYGWVLAWAKDGKPVASVESPQQCAVLTDPADRSVTAGLKRWRTKTETHAMLYLPDRIEHHVAKTPGAVTAGFDLVETLDNPLGVVPLIRFGDGHSEIDGLTDLTDALVKVTLDMVIASHAAGFGRRWVTGAELIETPRLDDNGEPVLDELGEPIMDVSSPFDESATSWAIGENAETKFGSFSEARLDGFETAVRVLVSQIMAVSALPSHYLGILTSQPTSADSLRASEASLVARVEMRQLILGRSWEQVGRLLIAIETGEDPVSIPLRVRWSPADSRSESQVSDSVTKLVQAGILPVTYALRRLGYGADEIAEIIAAREQEIGSGLRAEIKRYTAATMSDG